MVIDIMTRDVWMAAEPRLEAPVYRKATHVFWINVKKNVCYTKVHCIDILKRTQEYNMTSQNQRDIRYNFMIGGDGNVYEGRGWNVPPLLPADHRRLNSESCLIGFMGLFNTAKELPENMFKLGQDLVAHGVANEYIDKNFKFFDLLVQQHDVSTRFPRNRPQPATYESLNRRSEGPTSPEAPEREYRRSWDQHSGWRNPRPPSDWRYQRPELGDEAPPRYTPGPGTGASRWYDSMLT